MSNTQQTVRTVPASLIETFGTGPDTKGVIGKRLRITASPEVSKESLLFLLGLVSGAPLPVGAEGTVIHIAADGAHWVDFTDSPVEVEGQGPDNEPIWDMGANGFVEGKTETEGLEYEFIA